jgi:hypothetical protein
MDYPPPTRSNGDKPALARSEGLPPGSFMNPRRSHAELLYADGTWRPATVHGWHRLDVAHRQRVTQRWIFWLVRLQLPDGEKCWFEYDSLNLRPAKASSSSISET